MPDTIGHPEGAILSVFEAARMSGICNTVNAVTASVRLLFCPHRLAWAEPCDWLIVHPSVQISSCRCHSRGVLARRQMDVVMHFRTNCLWPFQRNWHVHGARARSRLFRVPVYAVASVVQAEWRRPSPDVQGGHRAERSFSVHHHRNGTNHRPPPLFALFAASAMLGSSRAGVRQCIRVGLSAACMAFCFCINDPFPR